MEDAVVDSHLETDPTVVSTAGRQTADTAGSWSEWGVQAATGFQDAADAVRNAHLAAAVGEHSAAWNPVAQRVASRVSSLGYQVSEAGLTVDDADVDNAHYLAVRSGAAVEQGSLFTRPVNI